jgi:hypothetical protein
VTVELTANQGSPWGVGLQLADDAGNPLSASGSITVNILGDAGDIIASAVMQPSPTPGVYFALWETTAAWPVGRLIVSMHAPIGGLVFVGPLVRLNVARAS